MGGTLGGTLLNSTVILLDNSHLGYVQRRLMYITVHLHVFHDAEGTNLMTIFSKVFSTLSPYFKTGAHKCMYLIM